MISHFSVLGDFYNHEEYDTESSLWHSYPWLTGSDNRIEFALDFSFRSVKTRWDDIAGSAWRDDVSGAANVSGFSLALFASLVSWEAQGAGDIGSNTDVVGSSTIGFVSSDSVNVVYIADSNSDSPGNSFGVSSISITSSDSQEIIFRLDTYSETPGESVGSSSISISTASSVIP